MTPRETLRTQLGIDGGDTGPHTPEVSDEKILNVLRHEKEKPDGEDELTTNEIAEELPIGSKQTHNRLKTLETDSRVEKRRAGRADMWQLASGEPETVVNPELGPVVEQSCRARRKAVEIQRNGIYLCAGSFVFLILGMTLLISETTFYLVSGVELLSFGYAAGVVGAFIIMAGTTLRVAGDIAPRVTERFLLD